MPVLSNVRQERFAQGVAGGLSMRVAYGEAGYHASTAAASHLRAKRHVQARILELQKEAELRFAMTRLEWLESLRRIAIKAEEKENYVAAKAALREIGLAMPNWYAPEERDDKITVIIKKI